MCIVFVIFNLNKEMPLTILTNRDEQYNRETLPLNWYEFKQNTSENLCTLNALCAKDISSCGAQFAVYSNGKFAVLTVFRESDLLKNKDNDEIISRGKLPILFGSMTIEEYKKYLMENHTKYLGFNLVFGTVSDVWFFSNRDQNYPYVFKKITHNFGIGNGYHDDIWWKVQYGLDQISNIENINTDSLFNILFDKALAPFNKVQKTEYELDFEYNLSGIYCSKYMINNKGAFGTIGSYVHIFKNDCMETTECCDYINPNKYVSYITHL